MIRGTMRGICVGSRSGRKVSRLGRHSFPASSLEMTMWSFGSQRKVSRLGRHSFFGVSLEMTVKICLFLSLFLV